MATFNERLLEYQKLQDAFPFSKKRIRRMHHGVKILWDKYHVPPPYKEERHGEQVFQVRNYPESFTPKIDQIIVLNHADCWIKEHQRIDVERVSPKPKRRRIPVKKPIYSTKTK